MTTIYLVSCVATKAGVPSAAKDLFRSPWFQKARRLAESAGGPWFVLSAKHGLVDPDEVLAPHNVFLGEQTGSDRRAWAERVWGQLEPRVQPNDEVVLLAGEQYRQGLVGRLRARGCNVHIPMQGMRIGEQLAWLDAHSQVGALPRTQPGASATARARPVAERPAVSAVPACKPGLARRISEAFHAGAFDLSARAGAPPVGWDALPECRMAARLRSRGASDADVRVAMTLVAALDRARDADRLWAAVERAHVQAPWILDPIEVSRRPYLELVGLLRRYGVSQRHTIDSGAWRILSEVLAQPSLAPVVHAAVVGGRGEASELRAALQAVSPEGSEMFPLLKGPKISRMWVRLLAVPGGAEIQGLDGLEVAVDVQVRKVTEHLGLTATHGQSLEQARGAIQDAWSADVRAHGAAGPAALVGTCAALDPAVWFLGKWGCTFCRRWGRRTPVGPVCESCTFKASREQE